jgi:putative ABC transport system substrate-binding protein
MSGRCNTIHESTTSRRLFNAVVLVLALIPFSATAQTPKVPTVGVLALSGLGPMGPFREALRELGYIEGRTINFEIRDAEGRTEILDAMAADLVTRKVDIVVVSQTPAAEAAKRATLDIPVVLNGVGDPVATGLVASLARPGGNITGMSTLGPELGAKNLDLIRDILPSVRRVALVANGSDPQAKFLAARVEEFGRAAGMRIETIMARGRDELSAAFVAAAGTGAEAVIVQPNLATSESATLALRYRLPEPPRDCRRLFDLSHAASFCSSSIA